MNEDSNTQNRFLGMKLKIFVLFVFGLFDVFCSVSPPSVGLFDIDAVVSEKNAVFGKNLEAGYQNIIVSILKPEFHTVDKLYLEHLPHNLTFHYMITLNNEEIEDHLKRLSKKEEKLHFLCKDEIVDYIVKNKINKVEFLEKNCIKGSFRNLLSQPTNRKLMQGNETKPETEKILEKNKLLFNLNQGNSNPDSDNCEIHSQEPQTNLKVTNETNKVENEEGSECCCWGSKNRFNNLESVIPNNTEELTVNKNSTEFDGFNISEIVELKDKSVKFEIEINDKNSIFDEILNAMKSDSESILNYASIEERDLSSSELKEALEETEKEINNRKFEIRSLKETSYLGEASSFSKSKSLRSNQNTGLINLEIKDEISGVSLLEIAERLTQRFIQTKEKEFEKYITTTKTKLLQIAIYEYLIIYSTLEDNLQKVVEIINSESGIFKLRSFFGNYVNFTSMKYTFEQYFARFDQVQKKRVYHKSDFTRFMLNLNINKLNPMLNSPVFNLKLKIVSMIVLYSENDPKIQKIVIQEEISNTNKQLFYRDNVFFNFLLVKHFLIKESDETLEKTEEIITKNRNNNPLDRPKQCFLKTKQLLIEQNIFQSIQNNEQVLKVICLQTYGLLGLYPAFDQL